MRSLALTVLLLSAITGTASNGVCGDEAPLDVRQAWVDEALVAAGANRAELEKVLAHFANEPERLLAARFLVAHMPGKGYFAVALKDAEGNVIPYDPLAYPDLEASREALCALYRKHRSLKHTHVVSDVETLQADYLIRHIDGAFEVWEGTPAARRVSFPMFLDYVLPYRGSEEPAEAWLQPMCSRLAEARMAPGAPGAAADAATLWTWVQGLVATWVRSDERYCLSFTDQGFAEMGMSGAGRSEDIANMTTYAARALGLATAADYTPAWGHRDSNHCWNVLLDADGKGHDPAQSHAPKVYRKTFAIQRDSLPFVLPKGRPPPNGFLALRSQIDVTQHYGPTTSLHGSLGTEVTPSKEPAAYLCVFSGGDWVAVGWARSFESLGPRPGGNAGPTAAFENVGFGGEGMLYLVALHDGIALHPVDGPWLVLPDRVHALRGGDKRISFLATAVAPSPTSDDAQVSTPVSTLVEGMTYVLHEWTEEGWRIVKEVVAGKEPVRFHDLPDNGLYWLVAQGSRRLERPFSIYGGVQRFH